MTLNEIAKIAKVSPTTVSFVLHNRGGVGQQTRERVLSLLRENGYMDKHTAGAPAAKKSFRFLKYLENALLVEGNDGFVSAIIDAAETEARDRGFNLVMSTCKENTLEETFSMMRSDPMDGIIMIGTELDPKYFSCLHRINTPIVVVDNYMPFCDVDSVVMNNRETVYGALRHLYELGHRRIGYLHSSFSISNFEERSEGYRQALSKFGLAYDPSIVFDVGVTLTAAFDAMTRHLARDPQLPTAFFCDNDTIAIGCMRALQQKGYSIPEDISMIGFDDIPFCTMADPPLTTMRISREQIGIRAVQMLCGRLQDNTLPVTKLQLTGELIQRGSTAQPKEN